MESLSLNSPILSFNPELNEPFLFPNKFLTNKLDSQVDYLHLILTAHVSPISTETPLHYAASLSDKLNSKIYLKREDMQPVHSFKCRGAFNKMRLLTPEQSKNGVICCSAGNHAQGVALAARHLKMSAIIVMPNSSPEIKRDAVKKLGGQVILHGKDFDEARIESKRLALLYNRTEIPPFDDPLVIAGQGTIAPEIFRQHDPSSISAIFVCVGGGGLIAGIAAYSKKVYPHIKIFGVEAFDAAGMTESIRNGVRTDLSSVGLFADGAAVRCVGTETFNICRNLVDGMILVSTDEICAAIKDVFEDTRSVLEPAGALSVAGIKKYMNSNSKSFDINPGTIIALCSGANMNFERLRFVSERADIGENKEVLMSVIIPEQPGTFYKLFKCVYPLKVTEFIYRYEDTDEAHVIMAFRVGDAINRTQEVDQVFDKIKSNGFTPNDLSNNEMAKAHGRFFGGGRKKVPNERLFRFQFPERPGELDRFLGLIEGRSVEMKWNVSLWHHRNLGGDFGHLMLGIQVGNETMKEFDQFIKSIQYPTQEETFNAIYRDFIG